ncbi:MAG: class I SAM-dependent methyltransferase [Hassallia sp. WJT32-NPBG1]|jgi:SAM-dependent methyltransferase|nr:class I SAM-dependent methyltransferase [Hassallia sp. WJT32-NPBG1]
MSLTCESRLSAKINTDGYIHGFTKSEQDRLIRQSTFFEPYIYTDIDFSKCSHILEVGCGVGAQIQLLLRRWPHLKVTGVDISQSQINRAREFLKPHIDSGRVSLHVSDGRYLPFADNSFDGAFVCFVLEHTSEPLILLKELKRIMQSGSPLYCTEAFNNSLYIDPPCPSFETYWKIFNDHQKELQGDPNVGMKLCNLALKADFSETTLSDVSTHLDNRNKNAKQREFFVDMWTECFLSVAPELLSHNKITADLVEKIKNELHSIKSNPDSVFVYSLMQLKALN